jgi:hypothetical protein
LLDARNNKNFKSMLIATLYAMKLSMPKEYEFIREHLTGGIRLVYKSEIPEYLPHTTIAYITPSSKDPVCKIVEKDLKNMHNWYIVRAISHESYHIYQYRQNDSNSKKNAD